jgi:hypothetical protein
LALDALQHEPQAGSSDTLNNAMELLRKTIGDFDIFDSIASLFTKYGSEVYVEGFSAGYRTATKLIVAGLQ